MYHRYKYLGIVKHSGLVGAKPPPEASEVLPHTVCGDTGFLGPVPKKPKNKGVGPVYPGIVVSVLSVLLSRRALAFIVVTTILLV